MVYRFLLIIKPKNVKRKYYKLNKSIKDFSYDETHWNDMDHKINQPYEECWKCTCQNIPLYQKENN